MVLRECIECGERFEREDMLQDLCPKHRRQTSHQLLILATPVEELARQHASGWDLDSMTPTDGGGYSISVRHDDDDETITT